MSLLYIAVPWGLIIAMIAVFYRDKFNDRDDRASEKPPEEPFIRRSS
jgi:hypothetical protein